MSLPRRIAAETTAAVALLATLAVPAVASAQGGGSVLVVGDSLEVGTEPYLRQELPGYQVTVDAKESRPSSAGLDVLRGAYSGQDVVVFDLGTNDDPSNPGALASNLAFARAAAGDACMVVATINRPPLGGVSDDGLNSAISDFAAGPNVQVADWRSAAQGGGVLQPDGVHGTASGYALRGQLVADAVRACRADSIGPPSGSGGGGAAPAPPEPVRSPKPEYGPGFALIVEPALALLERLRGAVAPLLAPVLALVTDGERD